MEKVLPLGSMVYLKEGSLKMMITGRSIVVQPKGKDKPLLFDYSAVSHPVGYMSDNKLFYFNVENIDRVIFEGFSNEDDERFMEVAKEWQKKNADEYERGKIDQPLEV